MLKKVLISLISVSLIVGCSSDDDSSPQPIPTSDISGNENNQPTESGESSDQATESQDQLSQDLSGTELSNYLASETAVSMNADGERSEVPQGWKGQAVLQDSPVDEDGYQEGLEMELLLMEDFTFEMRVKEIKIKVEENVSFMKAPAPASVLSGDWFAKGQQELVIQGLGQGQLEIAENNRERDQLVFEISESPQDNLLTPYGGLSVKTTFRSVSTLEAEQ